MKTKILFVISLLYGLLFINSGLNKFLNYIPIPEEMPENALKMFEAMMQITWLIPLLGVFEIIGGILIIIPRFRALGALILLPIVVGIVLQHITLGMGLPMTIVIFLVQTWIMVENRTKYKPLF